MATAFISYTHSDEALKDQFLQHLAPLRREGLISVWHDRMLRPGDHLDDSIQSELASSDLVILLVSAAFLNSEYCYEEEMRRAFERQRAGQAKVVSLILRPCQWKHVPVGDGQTLSSFLVVPRDGKPVTTWADSDEAFDDAVGAIRGLIVGSNKKSSGRSLLQDREEAPADRARRAAPIVSGRPILPRRMSDLEKDRFLKDTFERTYAHFSESLKALESSDAHVEADVERVDSQNFVSTVYVDGKKAGSCRVFTGAQHFGASICLSFDPTSRGSMNEWISLDTNNEVAGFQASGMAGYGVRSDQRLDQSEAAEYLWAVFLNYVKSRVR